MPSGLSQSHQEIAGQFQRELLQLPELLQLISASGAAGNMYSARRPGAWDGRLDCSAPAILLRAKKSEVLLTAQISE